MIIHGGSGDQVVINFQEQSVNFRNQLVGDGHFAFICNHGGGHRVPSGIGANIVQFFFDHPFGTNPSPYAGGLPSTFLSYCRL